MERAPSIICIVKLLTNVPLPPVLSRAGLSEGSINLDSVPCAEARGRAIARMVNSFLK
jgi:hypothetical protein